MINLIASAIALAGLRDAWKHRHDHPRRRLYWHVVRGDDATETIQEWLDRVAVRGGDTINLPKGHLNISTLFWRKATIISGTRDKDNHITTFLYRRTNQ